MAPDDHDHDECKAAVETLVTLYEDLEPHADGFMAQQDVEMKLTALRRIDRDIDQLFGENTA